MSALTVYERFKKIQYTVERVGAATSAVLVFVMALLTTADVALRFIFNKPIAGTILLMEFMMVALVYFGVAYVQAHNANIKMDMIGGKLPTRAIQSLDLFIHIAALAIFALVTWQAGLVAYKSLLFHDYASGLLPAPYWPAKSALTLGLSILCLRFVFNIIDDILKFRGFSPSTISESGSN